MGFFVVLVLFVFFFNRRFPSLPGSPVPVLSPAPIQGLSPHGRTEVLCFSGSCRPSPVAGRSVPWDRQQHRPRRRHSAPPLGTATAFEVFSDTRKETTRCMCKRQGKPLRSPAEPFPLPARRPRPRALRTAARPQPGAAATPGGPRRHRATGQGHKPTQTNTPKQT